MIRMMVKTKNFDVFARMRTAAGVPMVEVIQKETAFFVSRMQKNQMTGRPGLNVQGGQFRGSWFPETTIESGQIKTRAFSEHPGARIHQYGGVIVPRRGRFLRFKIGARVIFSKRVVIPKRLSVVETYQVEMPDRYKNAMARVLNEAKGT